MSLINLSSKTNSRNDILQQAPFNFKNFFPQPIIIKPHSQVCLTSFYHFRTKGFYVVSTNNNVIGYGFGDRQYNNAMYASLQVGMYNGNDLAFEMARAMNEVNVQQNYLWTVDFVAGDENESPPTFDVFTLTYSNIPTPDTKGGIWSKLSSRNQNGTLTNDDNDFQYSSLLNLTDEPLPIVCKKGLLLHEGKMNIEDIIYFSEGGLLTPLRCGLIRSTLAVDSNDMSRGTTFNSNYGDIMVEIMSNEDDDENILNISTLRNTAPRTPITSPNNVGKSQILRRTFDDTFIQAILPNLEDYLAIQITRVASNRSWVVTCQKSTDKGVTYVDIDDGQGTNADGEDNIYSQTIGGVDFTSILYSTFGVPTSGGGAPIQKVANSASNTKAPFIPFLELEEKNEQLTDLDLQDLVFTLSLVQGNPPLIGDNLFSMNWNKDVSGNGYLWGMFEESGAITESSQINSTLLENFVIGNLTSDGTYYYYDVFADNTVAIATATVIAKLSFNPSVDNFGQWVMSDIDASTNITLNPANFTQETEKPTPTFENQPVLLRGIFNPSENPISVSGEHIDPEDETVDIDLLADVSLGTDLAQQSYLLLSRPNADEISQFTDAPVRAENDLRSGTIAPLIGFKNPINVNNNTTYDFTSDTMPFPQIDETSIHISVPELTGVKSYEGESENIAKTIKVIPKNEFTEVSTSNSMTYTANYEEWIDINNAEELHINEMTLEVRKPNGEMATSLEPITRATIKIQQDPEIKKMEAQRQLIEQLSEIRTQGQNTGQIKLMNQQSWVGS
tara:strand:+ start:743 stop:3103 length:2361 start_codon:yes stop_codon:yes gene_type:complete